MLDSKWSSPALAASMIVVGSCSQQHSPCVERPTPGPADPCRGEFGTGLCGDAACPCTTVCIPAGDVFVCPEFDGWSRDFACLRQNALVIVPTTGERATVCVPPGACADLRARGVSCYFADGTAFIDGRIECECPVDEPGLTCGPGCSPCPAEHLCWGVSEASNVGACIRDPSAVGLIQPCGGTAERCESGDRCLRFATPSAPELRTIGFEMPGACLGAERCERLAALLPERFRCE